VKLNFRTVFWSSAAVGVLFLLAIAFRPRPVTVDLAEVMQGSMRVTVRDEGRTRVRNEYVVSAPVGGRLLRIDYKPGAMMQAGDTVARILPGSPAFLDARQHAEARASVQSAAAALSAAQADLERADAQAQYARTELQRVTELHGRELISVDAYDRARLELRVAESALSTARDSVRMREADLDAARIRLTQPGVQEGDGAIVDVIAPVSGRVLRVAQESESVIAAGAEVVTLGDPDDLEVVVEMLSTDAVQVRAGADVIIENWGRPEESLRGRVRLVEPYGYLKISALGVEEQRVNVVVDFAGPPSEWSSLGHGYRVEAAIVTWQADNVVQTSVASLFRSSGQWAVFRVENDRAFLTPVEVGRNNGRNAQILSGIDPGDTVVLYPGEGLSDGVRIKKRN
jgi:HlyD family secretion protein